MLRSSFWVTFRQSPPCFKTCAIPAPRAACPCGRVKGRSRHMSHRGPARRRDLKDDCPGRHYGAFARRSVQPRPGARAPFTVFREHARSGFDDDIRHLIMSLLARYHSHRQSRRHPVLHKAAIRPLGGVQAQGGRALRALRAAACEGHVVSGSPPLAPRASEGLCRAGVRGV